MKKILLLALATQLSILLNAQVLVPEQDTILNSDAGHKEIEVEKSLDGYNSFPIGNKGVLLTYKSAEKKKGGFYEFNITNFDTAFNEVAKYSVLVPKEYTIVEYLTEKECGYLLLANDLLNRNGAAKKRPTFQHSYFFDYTIVKIDLNTNKLTTYNGTNNRALFLNEMKVVDGKVILLGKQGASERKINTVQTASIGLLFVPAIFYSPNYDPAIITIDMKSKNVMNQFALNDYFRGDAGILAAGCNEKNGDFSAVMKHKVKKKSKYFLRNIEEGVVKNNINIDFPENLEMFRGKMEVKDNKKVFVGTYGEKWGGKFTVIDHKTEGICVGLFENNSKVNMIRIPWKKFDNTITTLIGSNSFDDNRKYKKSDADADLDVTFSKIIIKADEYVFLGEITRPRYYYITTTTTDDKGRRSTRTEVYYDGIQVIGLISFGVNSEGALLWENAHEYYGNISFKLASRADFYQTGEEQFTAVYPDKQNIPHVYSLLSDNTTPLLSEIRQPLGIRNGDLNTFDYNWKLGVPKLWYKNNYYYQGCSIEVSYKTKVDGKKVKLDKSEKKMVKYYYAFNKIKIPVLGE
ncbi:MAG: hypothetical protein ACEQSR_10925 [Candidatus Methylacidiphilales bacterium]